MVTFTKGDMFATPADIRINTVNCFGVMGKGVALEFKKRYPKMFAAYRVACSNEEIKPGTLMFWQDEAGDRIINFPTKRHWQDKSRYEDIASGLQALKSYLSKHSGITVVMPALGCGNGGLSWTIVSQMIEKHLRDLDVNVVVFEPNP